MKALICGVGGQDGAYLSKLLLDKGYEVIGASRDAMASTFFKLKRLGIRDRVATTSMAITDFRSVLQALDKYEPDEIYNLAGQSSVGLSFEQPVQVETGDVFLGLDLAAHLFPEAEQHLAAFWLAWARGCITWSTTLSRCAIRSSPRAALPTLLICGCAAWPTTSTG